MMMPRSELLSAVGESAVVLDGSRIMLAGARTVLHCEEARVDGRESGIYGIDPGFQLIKATVHLSSELLKQGKNASTGIEGGHVGHVAQACA